MPTCLYQKKDINGVPHWSKHQDLSLGGWNIIWEQWKKTGCKVDQGWEIEHDEIVSHVTDGSDNPADYRILVNVLPNRKGVIELLLLDEICLFTHGHQGSKKPEWSVYMMKLREFFGRQSLSKEQKEVLTICFPAPERPGLDVATFLYMHGEDDGWKPGRIGQMNGALIYSDARKYFQKHF